MGRLLRVLGLWCLLSGAGVAVVGWCAWALSIVGAIGLIAPLLVLGLACVFPVSLAVADNLVPRAIGRAGPVRSCPHCGVALAVGGPGPEPGPDAWPLG